MPNYKAVDSEALDANLLSIANAIREKVGTSEALAFPNGFVSAIEALASGGSGLAYDMGEFILDTDTVTGKEVSVPHNLGDIPEFICVWTDRWAGLTSENPVAFDDAKSSTVGFIWFDRITGMIYRASSTNSGTPLCVNLYINDNDYRVGAVLPTSFAYGVLSECLSEYTFSPPIFGVNGSRYRAGVTYKYFVSKAWWNVGGVADA